MKIIFQIQKSLTNRKPNRNPTTELLRWVEFHVLKNCDLPTIQYASKPEIFEHPQIPTNSLLGGWPGPPERSHGRRPQKNEHGNF